MLLKSSSLYVLEYPAQEYRGVQKHQKKGIILITASERYRMKKYKIQFLVFGILLFLFGLLIWGVSPKEHFTVKRRYQGYSKVSNLATFDPLPYKKRKDKPEYTIEIGMPYDTLDEFVTDYPYILVIERPNFEAHFPVLFPCRLVDMKEVPRPFSERDG